MWCKHITPTVQRGLLGYVNTYRMNSTHLDFFFLICLIKDQLCANNHHHCNIRLLLVVHHLSVQLAYFVPGPPTCVFKMWKITQCLQICSSAPPPAAVDSLSSNCCYMCNESFNHHHSSGISCAAFNTDRVLETRPRHEVQTLSLFVTHARCIHRIECAASVDNKQNILVSFPSQRMTGHELRHSLFNVKSIVIPG